MVYISDLIDISLRSISKRLRYITKISRQKTANLSSSKVIILKSTDKRVRTYRNLQISYIN